MPPVQIATNRQGFVSTARTDRWWLAPAATAAGLLLFFGYLTLRAFNGTYVWLDPYISPTVAPPVVTPASGYPGAVPGDHAWFGVFPGVVAVVPCPNPRHDFSCPRLLLRFGSPAITTGGRTTRPFRGPRLTVACTASVEEVPGAKGVAHVSEISTAVYALWSVGAACLSLVGRVRCILPWR